MYLSPARWQSFQDEAHIIYVNGAYRDESLTGKLMHDFSCKNPDDMYFKILADKTRYFKEEKKGVSDMSKIVEDLITDDKKEIALKMLRDGKIGKEKIARYFGLTLKEIEALEEEAIRP